MITPYSQVPARNGGQIEVLSLAPWRTADGNESLLLEVIEAVRDISLVDAGEGLDKVLVAGRDGALGSGRILLS